MDLQNRKCCDGISEFSRMFNINTSDCNLEKLMVCATKMHYHLRTQFMNTISHAKLKNASNVFLREIRNHFKTPVSFAKFRQITLV